MRKLSQISEETNISIFILESYLCDKEGLYLIKIQKNWVILFLVLLQLDERNYNTWFFN